MSASAETNVPQIIAVVSVSGMGKIRLAREAKAHLGSLDGLSWRQGNEIMLCHNGMGEAAVVKNGLLALPDTVMTALDAGPDTQIALLERDNGLALKRFVLREQEAEAARATDKEDATQLVRTVETNAMPDELLPILQERLAGTCLRHDVMSFLRGRQTLEAWQGRRLLGKDEEGDPALREDLLGGRLNCQQADGSWDGDPMLTARALRELSDLGLTREDTAVSRGADWLLGRAESEANPGMFFLSDRLVARQADILAKRRAVREGKLKSTLGKLRFAGRTASEARRLLAADDLTERSCGTRIMWPNAFALEALLGLGYEQHPRVQRAIESLMHGYTYWCECNYQLRAGTHSWRELPGEAEIAERERYCEQHYRLGGAGEIEAFEHRARVARLTREGNAESFLLKPSEGIQPCEVVTTRALRHARDPIVHRAAAAHLWRFAAVQDPQDGAFPQWQYNPSQTHMLLVCSYYDHPAAHVAIMRSIPWIAANQNPDGSWGSEGRQDASTLAVIRALLHVHERLPAGFLP